MRWGMIAVLLCGLLAGCTSVVRSGLSEQEAGALLLALDDDTIAASVKKAGARGTYEVRVPRADLTRALRVVRASGSLTAAQPAFEAVYAEPALVATPAEERARHAFATAGELARSIEALPNVRRARVHLTAPEPRAALDAASGTWRASLLVQREGGTPPIDESALRALLQGAVADLPASAVTVVQSELARPRQLEHTRIGPFTVAKRDAPFLRATLAGTLALNALLAMLLILVVGRRRARMDAV
jgi:type III secretory pathway lipoprotein EscJ